jgi:hypothetical protein
MNAQQMSGPFPERCRHCTNLPGTQRNAEKNVDIIVECFEEKVVGAAADRTWYPVCTWPLVIE